MLLKKQIVSSLYWSSLNTISSYLVSIIISISLTRLLLPSEFGLIAMLTVFIGIGEVLINSGMNISLIRSNQVDEDDFSIVFFFNVISSCIVYILIYLSAYSIAVFYNQPLLEKVIKIYSIIFIIDAFSSVQTTRLTKNLDFKTQIKVNLPSVIGSGFVGILCAFHELGVWSLVYLGISKSLLYTIQIWYFSKWTPKFVWNFNKFKYHFNFGYKLLISGLFDNFFVNIYNLIIGKYFVASQAGYFNRADSLKQLPVGVLGSILGKITFSLFSKVQDDNIRLKQIYYQSIVTVTFLIAPFLFTIAALGEPLFRLLFTEKWLPAVPYFQILCINGVLYLVHSYNLSILNVKGRSDLYLKLEFIKKTITIITIFATINFGIYGLLYGSVFISVISFFINTYYTGKLINYSTLDQFKDIIPYFLFGFIIALFVRVIDLNFSYQYNDFLRLIIGCLFAITVFLGISHLFKLTPYSIIKEFIKS